MWHCSDKNPVYAGMVVDPARYCWSRYGEAVGGGAVGNGKKARAGLVRARRAHQGAHDEIECHGLAIDSTHDLKDHLLWATSSNKVYLTVSGGDRIAWYDWWAH
ncbi:MAG: hypothetical protein K9N23_01175 [Akkermansiaceae bacterium]|nr:hypothetical protein [Akkermansiaceae bacterium]MCF7730261.1 hypothetical protein [Akkermansiaceae bacterium]